MTSGSPRFSDKLRFHNSMHFSDIYFTGSANSLGDLPESHLQLEESVNNIGIKMLSFYIDKDFNDFFL